MDVALIGFDGVDTAAQEYADARDRSGARARWRDQIGLVEHHDNDHLVLRGTSPATTSTSMKPPMFLLTPAGFAVGSVLGTVTGSQEGEASEKDREPTLLAEKLRSAVPRSGSAVVLAAEANVVDEMLSAFDVDDSRVTRRHLSEDELALIEVVLSDEPAAATSSGLAADTSRGAI
jgi:hypothetical protein